MSQTILPVATIGVLKRGQFLFPGGQIRCVHLPDSCRHTRLVTT